MPDTPITTGELLRDRIEAMAKANAEAFGRIEGRLDHLGEVYVRSDVYAANERTRDLEVAALREAVTTSRTSWRTWAINVTAGGAIGALALVLERVASS